MKKKLFSKEVEIVLFDVDEKLEKELIEEAYIEALRLQKIFNFYDEKSELSRLNKKRNLKVSEEFLEVLKKALAVCEVTNGKYDITLGKNILNRKNSKPEVKLNCSYKDLEIKGNEVILKDKDVVIDLGSIAKGYIADKLVEFFKSRGVEGGLIDARGDICLFGDGLQKVEVEHPREKGKSIISIKLKNCGVATSGDYNQFYSSFEKSHILNQKDLISITVVAPTLTEADLYATALFVLDKQEREDLIKENKQLKVFTIDKSLNTKYYNGFDKLICK